MTDVLVKIIFRKSMDKAIEGKRGHVFEKIKQLNSLLFIKSECQKKLLKLQERLKQLEPPTNYTQEKKNEYEYYVFSVGYLHKALINLYYSSVQ